MTLEFCDVNNGYEPALYTQLRKISEWMYDALDVTQAILTLGVTTWNMIFPSGLAFPVVVNGQLNDFRLPVKKVWALQTTLFGARLPPLPLPKIPWKDIFQEIFAVIDFGIPNSNTWYYEDPSDGQVKQGTEFTPNDRYYQFLSDGAHDFGPIILVFVIIYVMAKLGLFEAMRAFIQKAFSMIQNYRLKKTTYRMADNVSEIRDILLGNYVFGDDEVSDMQNDLSGLVTEIDANEDKLKELLEVTGVRSLISK